MPMGEFVSSLSFSVSFEILKKIETFTDLILGLIFFKICEELWNFFSILLQIRY